METRKPYPTDITDGQWVKIEPLLPQRRDARGAKIQHSRREMLNAIFYWVRNGCTWEALPHDFPPYKTVAAYQRSLSQRGIWVRILDALRIQVRQQAGREAEPSIVVLDSQSVKTTEKGACEVTMDINT
jgi:putative transposase